MSPRGVGRNPRWHAVDVPAASGPLAANATDSASKWRRESVVPEGGSRFASESKGARSMIVRLALPSGVGSRGLLYGASACQQQQPREDPEVFDEVLQLVLRIAAGIVVPEVVHEDVDQ